MKLKFAARPEANDYVIDGNVINGIDLAPFNEGSQFVGNSQTRVAGIFDVFWQSGELHVTLAQPTKTTDISWGARDTGWIDSTDYDPQARYVAATSAYALELLESGQAEYWQDPADGKWTLRLTQNDTQDMEPIQ